MFTTWNLLKMTHKQFKKANSLILSVLATTLFLMLLLLAVGCVSEKEVIYKRIYFADTNGVTTTIYYPKSFDKDLITPHDADRWRHIASKVAPDDGVAKEMKQPTPLGQFRQIPTWEEYQEQKQQQLADEYHTQHPECSYGYYR